MRKNLEGLVHMAPNEAGQAQIDRFCANCDFHNQEDRSCLDRSHLGMAPNEMAYLLTDQARYVLYHGSCGKARVDDVPGEMDEKGFHPYNVHRVASQRIAEATSTES